MNCSHFRLVISVVAIAVFSWASLAQVTLFTNKTLWQNSVGEYTTIDFTGYENGTLIDDEYTHLGVRFTDGGDFIHYAAGYLNDGVGLYSGVFPASTTMEFMGSLNYIAFDFPGIFRMELYSNNTLIYTSSILGIGGSGNFRGFTSTTPFNKVRVFNALGGSANIDDLYFGPPIPAPGALLAFLAAGALPIRTRRRR